MSLKFELSNSFHTAVAPLDRSFVDPIQGEYLLHDNAMRRPLVDSKNVLLNTIEEPCGISNTRMTYFREKIFIPKSFSLLNSF